MQDARSFAAQAAARAALLSTLCLPAAFCGCASPYHADRGAAFGGVAGAGLGAIVGAAVGDPLAGAAIGAGAGAITGAAVGSSLDGIEARNQAEIAARLGRPVPAGATTMGDVVAMTQAGVDEPIIISHIHSRGVAQALQPADLIYLKNSGVSPAVIQAMQNPPAPAMIAQGPPPVAPVPVIVEEHYYDPWGPPPPPYWHHHHHPRWHRHRHRHHGPDVSWGISFSH